MFPSLGLWLSFLVTFGLFATIYLVGLVHGQAIEEANEVERRYNRIKLLRSRT